MIQVAARRQESVAVKAATLDVAAVSLSFGGVQALEDVSFTVAPRSKCALIGPNGAGKTTLFNCINGLVRPQSGSIRLNGEELTRVRPHEVFSKGISRTFQGIALVRDMSVLENVMTGAAMPQRRGIVASALAIPSCSASERAIRSRALDILDELGLGYAARLMPGDLPFGTQKRVELARALMADPAFLMLDEPANGLTSEEVEELGRVLERIWEQHDLTLLLVEHHMGLVMSVSDDIVVLDAGKVIAHADPASVRNDPDVIAAYLGRRRTGAPE